MNGPMSFRKHGILFLSIAANIFLVAFVLGRFTGPGFPPPGEFNDESMPPHQGPHPAGRHGPPPFLELNALLTPEEMRAEDQRMRQSFDKATALRRDFAERLDAAPITKTDALKHFSDVDDVLDSVRKEAQDKAAEKIGSLSEENRHRLAKALLGRDLPPPPQE